MNRAAIFCFYNDKGIVQKNVENLLGSIRDVVDYLIIVVNGHLERDDVFNRLADRIIIRDNKGYDAGAYKTALLDPECSTVIQNSKNLVLCNDTFWGPFDPIETYFDEMKSKDVDFWGFSMIDNGYIQFVHSYFMVFRASILRTQVLEQFFKNEIDEDNLDYNKVLKTFEQGLSAELLAKGFKCTAHSVIMTSMYDDFDLKICTEGMPIFKKRAFMTGYYDREKILTALRFVFENYDYDINQILESARESYGIEITMQDILDHDGSGKLVIKKQRTAEENRANVLQFADNYSGIYIYGAGAYGKSLHNIIGADKILGFIVSDGQRNQSTGGIQLYSISDIKDKSTPIIVALSRKNTEQVRPILQEYKHVLFLWE